MCYQRAFWFFEKKRILEQQPKSAARLRNEVEHPGGFSLRRLRNSGYYIVAVR
jgi:hypothetical protein